MTEASTMSRRSSRLIPFALAALAAAGCGGSQTTAEAEPRPSRTEGAPAPEAEPLPPDEPHVARSALLATLDRGPGAFLQELFRLAEVRPHTEGDAFMGWRIVELDADAGELADIGLSRGDVVVAVNGYQLERPEYLHALFVELRDAAAIVVEGERGGDPFEIRVPVVDE